MVICLKPEEDDSFVSKVIRETGSWQGNSLDHLLSALHAMPDAAFLDLGANIGDSSVPVAAMRPRRQVVAVDPMAINLAYIKRSLEKNLLWDTERVRLVHSAVSDERGILYPYTPDPSNPGDTRMLRKEELKTIGEKKMEGVPAVLLQDILSSISSNTVVLKLDVQGYECRTLQRSILLGGGGKFIPAIFIEWAMVARDTRVKKDCPDYKNWKKNFFEGGYFPYEAADSRVTLKRIPDDGSLELVEMDVLWVHSSVEMRTAPCGDVAPSSPEQCYLFSTF
jgi:FkbM family methyltransferase